MKCPKCRFDNPSDTRFCGNCAAALRPAERPSALERTLEPPAYVLSKGSLAAGKYLITEEIGRGGMGVVYRAEDKKLARKVAVKVLPETFTQDPERLARFEREARVLASLNHPNIAAIYGVEEAEGKRLLVLELVEGETLAERLTRGALTLEETLDVCRQIAEGLEGAHEGGIVHRDLKPANVKITPEGKVKILDFGLAKAVPDRNSAVDFSKSPTITADMTQPGVILGTAAYMSPEQTRGRPVDKRTDIWAFGCILFECLTGQRVFPGETVTDIVAAILKGDPDWDSLPADTPGSVRLVLRRSLQKDPRERWRDIGDAWLEIKTPAAHPSEGKTSHRRISPLWLGAGALVVLLAGILIGRAFTGSFKPVSPVLEVSSTVKVEAGLWLDGIRRSNMEMQHPSRTALAISSDGRFVVYSAIEENPGPQARPRLFLRRMEQSEAKPIAGTEGGINPFLSPDNQWVGFWAEGKLKKVLVAGGVPITLCEARRPFGASWGRENRIVFADGWAAGLSSVSAEGGKPEILTQPDPKRGETSHRLPSWLPNGKAVLFTVMRSQWDQEPWLALLRLDTREWRVLLEDAADARYVATGHLVFLSRGTLKAVRFDLASLEVIGQPVALVENVMQSVSGSSDYNTAAGQFGISRTGSLIYAAGGVVPPLNNSLVWVDQKGMERPVTDKKSAYFAPRLSPDGQRISYITENEAREWQLFVYDLNSGTNSRLFTEGTASYAVWAPDGKRLLFDWQKSMVSNLFWQPYDGISPMEQLTTSEYNQFPGSWSSDGKTVALVEERPDTGSDIAVLDVSSRRVTPLLNSPFEETYPDFSPVGPWIAYTSNESGRDEVYVRPFPGPGMKHPVSNEGGDQPLWARDGKQLFYRRQDQMWVVDVRTDGGIATTSKPRLLFEKPGYRPGSPIRTYDLSHDGQQFLLVKLDQRKPTPITEMTLVLNWFDDLQRLVPSRKK